MKATEAKLLAFLKKSPQFVIPIYQRTYSWTEKECRQLWDDIIRTGKNDAISVHFVGSIVYIEEGLSQVSHQAPLLVIDGQQRLTTVTLLLAAALPPAFHPEEAGVGWLSLPMWAVCARAGETEPRSGAVSLGPCPFKAAA